MTRIANVIALLLVITPTTATAAAETLTVDDASRLQWVIYGSNAYFRNFNEIDPTWQGCCFNYYIDLTTDAGKAMFSAFLTKHASRQPLNFWVAEKATSPSRIEQLGNW